MFGQTSYRFGKRHRLVRRCREPALCDPASTAMSVDRLLSEGKNATAGPGNVLGNANEVKKAINAAVDKRTSDALQAAVRAIKPGAANSSVKINQYMTLYNGNKTGKGRPRPRLRISGLPMQVITPALGEGARMAAQYGSASARARALGTSALEAQRLGKFAAGQHWSKVASYMNGGWGGGVLAFAPSAALDTYKHVSRDVQGDVRFNLNGFLIDSAKSQSGNAAGWVAGLIAAPIAVAFGLTAAPVILVSLIAGVTVQIVWGATGMSDMASSEAERALGK
jgi:hypothetical protein